MHVSSQCLFLYDISVFCSLCDACDFQVFILWTYRFSVLYAMHVSSKCLFYGHMFFHMDMSVFCSAVMPVTSQCLFYRHIGFLFFMLCMFLPSVYSIDISVFCSLCYACFFQVFFLWTYRFSVLYVMHVSSKCLFYGHVGFCDL